MKPSDSSKTNDKAGIIDLGTNTFHLLIAPLGKPLCESDILRLRKYVRLAEESNHLIGPAPMKRGLEAMQEFSEIIGLHKITKTRAVGTAILRNADNSSEFIELVRRETGIEIEVISGEEEARLIFLGVLQSGCLSGQTDLLMDIGGGSVEFILAVDKKPVWLGSYDIGVSFLKHSFHQNEPMAEDEKENLLKHLHNTLKPLLNELARYQKVRLVGISGTFDVINEHFIRHHGPDQPILKIEDIREFINQIIPLNLHERIEHPSIPESRADMIPSALVLVDLLIGNKSIREVIVSPFSIKEGVFSTLV